MWLYLPKECRTSACSPVAEDSTCPSDSQFQMLVLRLLRREGSRRGPHSGGCVWKAVSLESAPIWSDVRTFPCELFRGRVAGLVGGFPCTDLSVAGKRAGINGEHSGLWFEYLRIIREVQPEWIGIENVPAVIAFPAGGIVLGGLAESGFDAEWISVRASDVGAPHKRERVFILAWRRGMEDSARDGWFGREREDWRSGRRGICETSEQLAESPW